MNRFKRIFKKFSAWELVVIENALNRGRKQEEKVFKKLKPNSDEASQSAKYINTCENLVDELHN